MGLFGIKKASDGNKPSGTFINEAVINAEDYSNMPNKTVIGYGDPTLEMNNNIINNVVEPNVGTTETFVVSQIDTNNFNNQQSNDVVITLDSNTYTPIDLPTLNTNENYVQDNVPFDNSALFAMPAGATVEEPEQLEEVESLEELDEIEELDTSDIEVPVTLEVPVAIEPPVVEVPAVIETPVNLEMPAVIETPAVTEVPVVTETPVMEVPVVTEVAVEATTIQDVAPQYDPLNNGSNPVPVNPVAEDPMPDDFIFEEEEEVKTTLVSVLKVMFRIIVKPSTTIIDTAKKYTKLGNSLLLTFWIGMFSFLFCLIGRLVAGSFSTSKDAISGASKILLDFSDLFRVDNYLPFLLITLLIGIGAIIIVALVYYFASFVNSKGVHVGVYFALSSLSLVPTILGFTLVHPLLSILSMDIALLALIFSVIYSLIILVSGVNSILKFKTADGGVLYNAINIAIILSIMVFIFTTLSTLNILDLWMLLR